MNIESFRDSAQMGIVLRCGDTETFYSDREIVRVHPMMERFWQERELRRLQEIETERIADFRKAGLPT